VKLDENLWNYLTWNFCVRKLHCPTWCFVVPVFERFLSDICLEIFITTVYNKLLFLVLTFSYSCRYSELCLTYFNTITVQLCLQ